MSNTTTTPGIAPRRAVKFSRDMTREKLLSRVKDGRISAGNRYSSIKHLLSKEQDAQHTERVVVCYTARAGEHRVIRYV